MVSLPTHSGGAPWKRSARLSRLTTPVTWCLPPSANVVTGKWIFKLKLHADGSLERYKARYVLQGFTQPPESTTTRPSVRWSSLPPSGLFWLWLYPGTGRSTNST